MRRVWFWCVVLLIGLLPVTTVHSTVKIRHLSAGYPNSPPMVSSIWRSFYKTIVQITVSEEGVGYTDAIGRGLPEGPNALEVEGKFIYLLDNVHHRVLQYDKDTGYLVDAVSFPEEFWAYSLGVDAKGNIYLLDVGVKAIIVLTNGRGIVKRLDNIGMEPVAGFEVSKEGEIYVVRSGEEMETLVLRFDPSGELEVINSLKGTMSRDGTLWQIHGTLWDLQRSPGLMKANGISFSMLKLNERFRPPDWKTFKFPNGLADPTNAFHYLGKAGTALLFRITTDKNELLVGLNAQTGEVEGIALLPGRRYAYPTKDISIDASGDLYFLYCSADEISILKVAFWASSKEIPLLLQKEE